MAAATLRPTGSAEVAQPWVHRNNTSVKEPSFLRHDTASPIQLSRPRDDRPDESDDLRASSLQSYMASTIPSTVRDPTFPWAENPPGARWRSRLGGLGQQYEGSKSQAEGGRWDIPAFGPLLESGLLQPFGSGHESSSVVVEIHGILDKGFFLADNEWSCYRRNYFTCICSYTLEPHDPGITLQYTPPGAVAPLRVYGFGLRISAEIADTKKAVEIVQHTSKRHKGLILRPEVIRMAPTNHGPGQAVLPTEHVFERLQFKQATANNGKRRTAQQYYRIVLELVADVGSQAMSSFVTVAYKESEKLIVRGRSPGHNSSFCLEPSMSQDYHAPSVMPEAGDAPSIPTIWAPSQLSEAGEHASRGPILTPNKALESDQMSMADMHADFETKIPNLSMVKPAMSPDFRYKTSFDFSSSGGDASGSTSTAGETSVSGEDDTQIIWAREKKQMLIDAVMRSLCAWLDSRMRDAITSVAEQENGTDRAGEASISGTADHGAGTRGDESLRSAKRRRTGAREDEDCGEEAKPKPGRGDTDARDEPPRFACPYFKRNPRKYCRESTCVGPGWVEIHRLK